MSETRLEIRRTEPHDSAALREIHAQPGVIWGTLQLPFPSAEQWRRRVSDAPERIFGLVACVDTAVVGSLGLVLAEHVRRRHVAELGMAVHDAWQGRGIGAALLQSATDLADRWLNVVRLELTVFADNERAIRLYRRFGFVAEGRLTKFAFRDGSFCDALCMARVH
jgi:putative acetyltransferase